MIIERVGDLLDQPDLTHIAHQANLYKSFGAGLARAIAARYPHGYAADAAYGASGDARKLGTYSLGFVADGTAPAIVNLYSQLSSAPDGVVTDYAALRRALTALEADLRAAGSGARLGLPYRLGCGIAGGDWRIVSRIILDVFADSPVMVVLCILPAEAARA